MKWIYLWNENFVWMEQMNEWQWKKSVWAEPNKPNKRRRRLSWLVLLVGYGPEAISAETPNQSISLIIQLLVWFPWLSCLMREKTSSRIKCLFSFLFLFVNWLGCGVGLLGASGHNLLFFIHQPNPTPLHFISAAVVVVVDWIWKEKELNNIITVLYSSASCLFNVFTWIW